MSEELNTMPELTLDPTGAAAAAQAAQEEIGRAACRERVYAPV